MNKGLTVTLIILLSILLFSVIGFMIFVMNGNLDLNNFSVGFSSQSKTLIDSKQIENIKNINIDSDVADIYIEENASSIIKVELYSDEADKYEITEENDQIKIVLKEKSNFKLFRKNGVIKVFMPKTYDKKIMINEKVGDIKIAEYANADLVATLTTGDIDIKDINTANINLTTGDINIINSKELKLVSTTGDFEIGNTSKLDITTRTGDIEITTVNESLSLETTTGDIEITNATIKENSKIKSGTGDIKIKSATGCYIDAKTKIGDTKVNNNDRKSEKELVITSRVGDIKVNY